jgi:hypothetical protein
LLERVRERAGLGDSGEKSLKGLPAEGLSADRQRRNNVE